MAKHFELRTADRAIALQVLYQGEIVEKDAIELVKLGLLTTETQAMGEYAQKLIEGVCEQKPFLDQKIDRASDNWSIDRMPAVDRSLLRLAAYEMLYVDEVPTAVAINEAVNLAKEFGGDDSPRFINGILGRIANRPESVEAPVEEAPAEPIVVEQPSEEEAIAAVLEAIAAKNADEAE